jgi:hypothetical protein
LVSWLVEFSKKKIHLKNFVVVVDDVGDGTGDANERDALRVGRQLDRPLGGDGVARVEHGSAGQRTEHGLLNEFVAYVIVKSVPIVVTLIGTRIKYSLRRRKLNRVFYFRHEQMCKH